MHALSTLCSAVMADCKERLALADLKERQWPSLAKAMCSTAVKLALPQAHAQHLIFLQPLLLPHAHAHAYAHALSHKIAFFLRCL